MVRKNLLIVMAISGVMLTGCPKSDRQAAAQAPAAPAAEKNPAAAKAEETFNKFYTGGKDTAKAAEKPAATFSIHKPEPAPVKKPESAEAPPVAAVEKPAPQKPTPAPVAEKVPASPVVRPSAKPQASTQMAVAAVPAAKGSFAVQVASTPSNSEAEGILAKFKKMGYPAYILSVQNPRADLEGTYYRVRIGGFATEADGKTFGETVVKPEHLDYWVVHKSNETGAPADPAPRTEKPIRIERAPARAATPPAAYSAGAMGTATSRRHSAGEASMAPSATVASPAAGGSTASKETVPSLPAVRSTDTGVKPLSAQSSGTSAHQAAASSDGYPTFDQLMKAIDDDSHKSTAGRKSGSPSDSSTAKQ